jgi:hypothetical protein
MPRDAIERLARRAGLEGDPAALDTLGFRDRFGNVHLPPQGAEILARAFPAAEPETVLTYIEGEEEEMRARGYLPGERIYHQFLREYKPGFALARQWAGFTEEMKSRCSERRSDGSRDSSTRQRRTFGSWALTQRPTGSSAVSKGDNPSDST